MREPGIRDNRMIHIFGYLIALPTLSGPSACRLHLAMHDLLIDLQVNPNENKGKISDVGN